MRLYLEKFKIGFSIFGLLAFALQELPYIPWLLWPPLDNPLQNNNPANIFVGLLEQAGGIFTVALLILIVRKTKEKANFKNIFIRLAILCLVLYYTSWVLYFLGITNVW